MKIRRSIQKLNIETIRSAGKRKEIFIFKTFFKNGSFKPPPEYAPSIINEKGSPAESHSEVSEHQG